MALYAVEGDYNLVISVNINSQIVMRIYIIFAKTHIGSLLHTLCISHAESE